MFPSHHSITVFISMNVMENAIVREVLCKYSNLLVSKLSSTKEEKNQKLGTKSVKLRN